MFKWAVGAELISPSVHQALQAVTGLQLGRTPAREAVKIRAVPAEHVAAVLPFLSRPVAAMVRLQLLTGCRLGEVVCMRRCDLTPGEPNWEYRPASHKNRWRGQGRVIPLGPQAQAVIREFLDRDPSAFLFDPREVVAAHHARRTHLRKTIPTPSELARRCTGIPGDGRADKYDRRTYRQAIVRACRRVGVPAWSPLRLRHAAAEAIRSQFGLEGAQVVLGHAKPDTTLIYVERDLARAHAIAAEVG
jgi:integrase